MAECSTDEAHEGNLPETGRVRQVSKKWRVYEDGVMAQHMQNDEFEFKYGLNRFNRQTSRADVPVAKLVHSVEEERMQQEHFHRLEEMNNIAAQDAEMARLVQEDELKKNGGDEQERKRRAMEDAAVASQFQQEELLRQRSEKLQLEMTDEEYAKYLQEKEKRRYERKLKERELTKQRKTLQKEQEETAGQLMTGYKMESAAASFGGDGFPLHLQAARMTMRDETDKGIMRTDGRVEDIGDFSDFYIQPSKDMDTKEVQELQELQDEELARLLQDQEHKRGSHVDRQKLQEIEERDAEIARLLYKQEKLKAKKHHQKHHQKRGQNLQDSAPASRDAGVSPMERSHSVPTSENQQNDALLHEHMQATQGQTRPLGDQRSASVDQRAGPVDQRSASVDQRPIIAEDQRSISATQRLPSNPGTQQITINPAASNGAEYATSAGQRGSGEQYGGSSGRGRGGENPYSTRPLPSPPAPNSPSELPLPGYSTQPQPRRDADGNVFSTIDPTFSGPPPLSPHQPLAPGLPLQHDPQYANTGAHRNPSGEDGYQDLDELRPPSSAADFAPVAGQKRPKSGKGGKDKANCKQQ